MKGHDSLASQKWLKTLILLFNLTFRKNHQSIVRHPNHSDNSSGWHQSNAQPPKKQVSLFIHYFVKYFTFFHEEIHLKPQRAVWNWSKALLWKRKGNGLLMPQSEMVTPKFKDTAERSWKYKNQSLLWHFELFWTMVQLGMKNCDFC